MNENQINSFIFVTDPFYTGQVNNKWKKNKNFKIIINKSIDWPTRENFFEYTKNKKIILKIYLKNFIERLKTFSLIK